MTRGSVPVGIDSFRKGTRSPDTEEGLPIRRQDGAEGDGGQHGAEQVDCPGRSALGDFQLPDVLASFGESPHALRVSAGLRFPGGTQVLALHGAGPQRESIVEESHLGTKRNPGLIARVTFQNVELRCEEARSVVLQLGEVDEAVLGLGKYEVGHDGSVTTVGPSMQLAEGRDRGGIDISEPAASPEYPESANSYSRSVAEREHEHPHDHSDGEVDALDEEEPLSRLGQQR